MPVLALADVAAVAFALVAMLAVFLLGKVLVAVIPDIHIPLVGNLKDKVNAGFSAAMGGLTSFLDGAIGDTGKVWHLTVKFFTSLASTVWGWANDVSTTFSWLATTYIPREVGKVRSWAVTELTKAAAVVKADLGKAERYAVAKVGTLANTVKADLTRAEHYALAKVSALEAKVATDVRHLESYAVGKAEAAEAAAKAAAAAALADATRTLHAAIVGVQSAETALARTVTGDIASIEAKVDAIVTTSAAGIIGAIGQDIENICLPLWPELTGQVASLEQTLSGDFTAVKEWVDGIPSTAAADVAGLAAVALSAVGIITKLADDCIVPQCRNLGDLSHLLEDLGGLIGGGALLAFLVEVAQDPHGAAQEIDTYLTPLAESAIGDISNLLGVGA